VEAAQTGAVVLVEDMATERRWPDYTPATFRSGVRSSLSVPLPTQDRVTGAINAYSTQPHAFDDHDLPLARAFAGYAGVAIANARLYHATASLARQMEAAMASRAVIEQAKGMIIAHRRCSGDEAFQILARASQRSNRKLRDVAAEIVGSATGSSQPHSPVPGAGTARSAPQAHIGSERHVNTRANGMGR
jgi:GAF domain-containing protein